MHHANLLIGTPAAAESYLSSLCESLGISLANNPDFFLFREESFGVEEARRLKSLAARKAVGDRKIFFITSARMTHQAQNALLKTFEDPAPDTNFFVSVREEEILLPTLRSRMMAIRLSEQGGVQSAPEEFLALPIKGRIAFAGKFAESEKSLPEFLNGLLLVLRKGGKGGNGEKGLETVHKLIRASGNASPASRLVLEHLALVL